METKVLIKTRVFIFIAILALVMWGSIVWADVSAGNQNSGALADSSSSSSPSATSGINYKVYQYTAPNLAPTKGTEVSQLGSLFGSMSLANTEDFIKEVRRVDVIIALLSTGLITEEEAKKEVVDIIKDLRDASRAKRFLSLGFKTRGKHLFNLFGILATDSWRD